MQENIGERIRKMREAQNLTREELSRMADITVERLTAFEDGEEVPLVGIVIKLSRLLGAKAGGIFHGIGGDSRTPVIYRAGQGGAMQRPHRGQTYTYEALSRAGAAWHDMEPFIVTFPPSVTGAEPLAHEGQEFVYVLEGSINLYYDGKTYALETGDSTYIDAAKPHLFTCKGENAAKMLVVVSSRT